MKTQPSNRALFLIVSLIAVFGCTFVWIAIETPAEKDFERSCSQPISLALRTDDPRVAIGHLDRTIRFLDRVGPASRAHLTEFEYQEVVAWTQGVRGAHQQLQAAVTSDSPDVKRNAMMRAHQLLIQPQPRYIQNYPKVGNGGIHEHVLACLFFGFLILVVLFMKHLRDDPPSTKT